MIGKGDLVSVDVYIGEVISLATRSGKEIAYVAFTDMKNARDLPRMNDGSNRVILGYELSKLRKIYRD